MLSLTLADDRGEIRSSQENLEVELNRADRVPESGVSNVESGIDLFCATYGNSNFCKTLGCRMPKTPIVWFLPPRLSLIAAE
jgi:hypothetical protein